MEPTEAQGSADQLNFSFDSEFLSHQTFELDHPFKGMNPFDGTLEMTMPETVQTIPVPEEKIMEGPGILYTLQRGSHTFCLRGIPCKEVRNEWDRLNQDAGSLQKIFRTQELEDIHFFPTPSLECAEVVWEHYNNRRFPYVEDVLCNLSDPGFSWWFSEGAQGFSVYFKSHGIERNDHFISLGPIGDPRITSRRFSQLKKSLEPAVSFSSFCSNETQFSVEADLSSLGLCESIGRLFLDGDFCFTEEQLSRMDITLICFFEELAFSRRFWIEVENQLDEEEITFN